MTKIIYVYENHLGGVYLSEVKQWLEMCESCGDSDHFAGTVETLEELINLFTDEDGFIMYDIEDLEIAWKSRDL